MKANLSVHMYARASKANATGHYPIYVRITIDGKRSEKFIEEDRAKTQSIAELSKAVLDLTNEVKKMKEGK